MPLRCRRGSRHPPRHPQGRAGCRTTGPACAPIARSVHPTIPAAAGTVRTAAHSAALPVGARAQDRARAGCCRPTSPSWHRRNSACRCAATSARTPGRRARIRSVRLRSRDAGTADRHHRRGGRWSCPGALRPSPSIRCASPGGRGPRASPSPGDRRSKASTARSRRDRACTARLRPVRRPASPPDRGARVCRSRRSWPPRTAHGLLPRRRARPRSGARSSRSSAACARSRPARCPGRSRRPHRARPCPRDRPRRICR